MESPSQVSPPGMYTFVFIPANTTAGLVEHTASLACGLEDEQVQKIAKLHFFGEIPDPFQMVDICTIYVPSASNGYIGVSLYSHADANLPANSRATEIVRGCGHTSTVIHGDAYISRCYDNEEEPWERRDLFATEARADAPWVLEAGRLNKGRNMNAYTSGGAAGKAMQQMMGTSTAATADAVDPAKEAGSGAVRWMQTNDDIEIKIAVPADTQAKMINVKFKPASISVSYPNMAAPGATTDEAEGVLSTGGCALYGSIHPDECTWSLEGSEGGKFLTITLEKVASKINWARLTKA